MIESDGVVSLLVQDQKYTGASGAAHEGGEA